jgi:parallel beta-helix repeat protein
MDRSALVLAQGNQIPSMVASSTKNINAVTKLYDGVDELYGYVNQVLQGIYDAEKFSKLGIINVKDAPFNAKGDGIKDDTSAIQNAVNASKAKGGGIVFFPEGTYVSNNIKLPSGVTLQGSGRGVTTIKLRNNATVYATLIESADYTTGAFNLSIFDLTLDGNKSNQSTSEGFHYTVNLGVVDTVVIERVEIINVDGDGIFIGYSWANGNTHETPSKNVTIRDVSVLDADRNGIAILYCENVLVDNCDIKGACSSALVDIENHHNNDYIRNVTVQNSRLTVDSGGSRVKCISNGFAAANQNVKFINNQFYNEGLGISQFNQVDVLNNRFYLPSDFVGVEIAGSNGINIEGNYIDSGEIGVYALAVSGVDPSNVRIVNNQIRSCTAQGVYITNGNNIHIEGNTIINNTTEGVHIDGTSTIVTIVGNRIYDTRSGGSKTQNYAISFITATSDLIITGNYLLGNALGVLTGTGASAVDPTKVSYGVNDDGFVSTAKILTKTANYTMLWNNELILVDCTSGAKTVNFPDATLHKGRIFTIKKIDISANTVTVGTAPGTQNIDSSTTKSLSSQWQSIRVMSDGANYYTF